MSEQHFELALRSQPTVFLGTRSPIPFEHCYASLYVEPSEIEFAGFSHFHCVSRNALLALWQPIPL